MWLYRKNNKSNLEGERNKSRIFKETQPENKKPWRLSGREDLHSTDILDSTKQFIGRKSRHDREWKRTSLQQKIEDNDDDDSMRNKLCCKITLDSQRSINPWKDKEFWRARWGFTIWLLTWCILTLIKRRPYLSILCTQEEHM